MASVKELMEKFGWNTQQGAIQYIKNHMKELNRDGKHAKRIEGRWELDAVAVKRLEELRGFGLRDVAEQKDAGSNKQLADSVIQLQSQLTTELKKTVTLQEQLMEAVKAGKDAAMQAAVMQEKLEAEQRENKLLMDHLLDAAEMKYHLEQEIKQLKEMLDAKNSRKWWEFWK